MIDKAIVACREGLRQMRVTDDAGVAAFFQRSPMRSLTVILTNASVNGLKFKAKNWKFAGSFYCRSALFIFVREKYVLSLNFTYI